MSGEMASAFIEVAKLSSNPLVIRFRKLEQFANTVGLNIRVDGDYFVIYRHGKDLYKCGTTDELNDWFKENYMEEVL